MYQAGLPASMPQSANVPGGLPASVPQSANVPGGLPASVPQSANVPGGLPVSMSQSANVPGEQPVPVRKGASQLHGGDVPQGQGGQQLPNGCYSRAPQATGPMPPSTTNVPLTGSAQQWLGEPGNTNPLLVLTDGMAQLQAAMLKQMDKGGGEDKSPETVKPGQAALPTLPEVHADTACVDVMDWMEMIDGPMSDLSDSSAGWWRRVTAEAQRAYSVWTLASPLDKLAVAPDTYGLEDGKYSRLNSRAAAMVVSALHASVRQEVVARRLTGSTVRLIFRILTLYQPGGSDEKFKILQNLQAPAPEQDASKAVVSLRAWSRWLRRCSELGVQAPDPSLLARGLTNMVRGVLDKNQDATFRTSLVKSTLQIDSNPNYEKVDSYFKHLIAECEAMSVASATTTITTTQPPKTEPRLRPLKPEPKATTTPTAPSSSTPRPASSSTTTAGDDGKPTTTKAETPCRFFGKTAKGCTRAGKCPFLHSWEGLDKKDRCLSCGGKGHVAKECPIKKTPPSSSGNTPKNDKNNQATSTSTSTRTVRIDDKPEVNTVPSSTSEASTAQADLKDVLADVGKVLKAMQATTLRAMRVQTGVMEAVSQKEIAEEIHVKMPKKSEVPEGDTASVDDQRENAKEIQVKMPKKSEVPEGDTASVDDQREIAEEIQVKMFKKSEVVDNDLADGQESWGPLDTDTGSGGLLDSGASHPMRSASPEEYHGGCPVTVTLAGEDVRVLRQNPQGTVLVEGRVQPIVPLGALIKDLGYTLQWGPNHLKLSHPEKGPIKVRVQNNCPEVAACDALAMIRELELAQVTTLNRHVETLKARLEVLKLEERREWPELVKEYMNTGKRGSLLKAVMKCPFTKGLPSEVQSLLLEDFNKDDGATYLKALPLPRRKRKALMNSNNWVVAMFLGENDHSDPFRMIPMCGKVVLEVDIAHSRLWDLHLQSGVYRLLLWAASKGKISDVVSSLPDRTWQTAQAPRRGLEAAPLRTKRAPYGRKDLNPHQQQQVHRETAFVAKQMLIWLMSTMAGRGNVGFLMELHADPPWTSGSEPPYATLWRTELWQAFKSVAGMATSSFCMGALGHRAARPTVVASNYPAVLQVNGQGEEDEGCIPATLMTRSEMRKWSHNFKHLVMESITDFHAGKWVEEEELANLGVKLTKLTREQREAWKAHLLNDHQPYRSDCSVCINAQANGYQHRRRKHPHLYTVALDVAGPFATKGRDMEFDDYRYMLVAAYRCPKDYLRAKALTDEDRELYVPSDDDTVDPETDPFTLEVEEEALKDDEVESGAEDEYPVCGPKTLDEEVSDLTEPIETETIYLARPMRRRTTSAALAASREILLQLRQSGLHVNSIHTDRAREFGSKVYKSWVGENELRHTRSAGADPSGNSTAELAVKWIKQRARTLIKGGHASTKDWPMAMHHATASMWSRFLPDSPWTNPPAAPFGCEVWFRAKTYKGTKEKKQEAADMRWKRGWYRGPSTDVSRGHLLEREDGGLVIAKGVKFNVQEPSSELRDLLPPMTAEGLDVQEEATSYPSKTDLIDEIEFTSRYLLNNEIYDLEEVRKLYNKLEELGDTDLRIGKKTAVTSWYTGAFVHGGCAGVRRNLGKYPNTTKFLTKVATKYANGQPFSALGIARNATLGMHRDVHNWKESKNIVLPISDFSGGALWTQDADIEEENGDYRNLPNGTRVKGRVTELKKGEAVSFSPTKWHEVLPWEGDRVVMLMYTPRATKLSQDDVEKLHEAGFVVPPEARRATSEEEEEPENNEEQEVKIMSVNAYDDKEVYAFVEVTDDDLLFTPKPDPEVKIKRLIGTQVQEGVKSMMKKAEVQYTANIEAILEKCDEEQQVLDVTHNVSLQEVKRNLSAWRASALKEYRNLKDNKKAFVVKKKDQLPAGCRIVPSKGVYTVKPDKDDLYRRKTRFVACGNHVPEGQEGMELFAAGLDATTLRTMLAYTIGKPWSYGTTDIRQAFVLAPWLGLPVALQPPAIAYELGIAEPGDYWLVMMSIYGLRESPALWSKFRNEQLEQARWTADIDGVQEELRLVQLVTDDQVWKIVRTSGDQEPLGYIMIYVDDLLINAQPTAMTSFYEWLAARWECDSLDVLSRGHSIRFLGMEMHLEEDGVELAQEGFVRELLRAHGHDGSRVRTQGPKDAMVLTLEEEQAIITAEPTDLNGREDEVKMAQRRVGELLWLAGRTRPDLQYVTALLSSRITRCPEVVNRVGVRLLAYLNETLHYRLRFQKNEEGEETLRIYTDSSFAPSSGRSHGAAGVFVNNNPVAWRSSRQQLVTLSTAESELLEAVEGTVLGTATCALLEELKGTAWMIHLHVDNQSAIMLLQGSTGSWRTRHLRLRANYVKEKIQNEALKVLFEPGLTQRADLGTKPFTKERLLQLTRLWNIVDRRKEVVVRTAATTNQNSWLSKLLMFCQICGAIAQKEQIRAEVPWDLYIVVLILAVAVIGLWEASKSCCRGKEIRLQALRARSSYGRLTRAELKELQRLLALEPGSLTDDQGSRLLFLKDLFEQTMPANTSPAPTIPPDQHLGTSSTSSTTTPPSKPMMRDQETQKDYEPVFERVLPPPPARVETFAGPYYHVPGTDTLHIIPNCWGLRNTDRARPYRLCRCCIENGGESLYDRRGR